MSFVDFAEVKASHPIESLIERLDLKMNRRGEQWRGPCPICHSGGERALVITPSKSAFYCFATQRGGDVIALVAHIEGVGMKEAAVWISGEGQRSADRPDPGTVPNERKGNEGARVLKPLTYLETDHPALRELGLSPETCEAFGAGYAPKGIMRGRLAIPIHDWSGELVAYAGRAVTDDQSPALIFPNGFRPEQYLFNAHRVGEGELYLTRDPLAVLTASDAGIANVACSLTGSMSAEQLQMLAALMDERGCDNLEVF